MKKKCIKKCIKTVYKCINEKMRLHTTKKQNGKNGRDGGMKWCRHRPPNQCLITISKHGMSRRSHHSGDMTAAEILLLLCVFEQSEKIRNRFKLGQGHFFPTERKNEHIAATSRRWSVRPIMAYNRHHIDATDHSNCKKRRQSADAADPISRKITEF